MGFDKEWMQPKKNFLLLPSLYEIKGGNLYVTSLKNKS